MAKLSMLSKSKSIMFQLFKHRITGTFLHNITLEAKR